jgi:hypothetical protein
MTTVPQTVFPTALVTHLRAQYWRSQWMIQLTQEMRKPEPREEVITRCEEHIAICSLAMEALRNP